MLETQAVLTSEAWVPALTEDRLADVGRLLDVELRRLGATAAARTSLRELIEGVWWSGGGGDSGRSEVFSVIREVVPLTAGDIAEPLLALYIRSVCETAWDLTWDHGPLLEVIRVAERSWIDHPPRPGSEALLGVRALLALTVELELESAISTGDLRTTAQVAARARDTFASDRGLAGGLEPSALTEHVIDLLTRREVYVDAVHAAAQACADFLEGLGDDLDEARRTLEAAEAVLADDHASLSELRSHRASVERLRVARDEDWLRVDEGSVACIFPFGLRNPDQSQIVSAVKAEAQHWVLGGSALDNNPTGLLLVDDMWRGDDPLHQRFEGTQLDLPHLHLVGRDGDRVTGRVTVVISQLGNHYVRVEFPLEMALPHEVGALVWMAAPEYGALPEVGQHLQFGDAAGEGVTWPRLSGAVSRVLDDLVGALHTAGLTETTLSFRPGMYHVVTTVREASVLPGGRASLAVPLDAAARIPAHFGSQPLCHPLPPGAGSIVSWARYRAPVGTRVECGSLTDEYLLVSENHTLLASFSSPDYMVSTVGQAAEFAVSLEGMFAAWQDELSDFYLGLVPHLRPPEPDIDLAARLADLERRQLRLRRFLTAARVTLLFIASPALVTSPVMRSTLTQLLELRDVWTRRTDFTEVAGQALSDRVTDLIETWQRRREEARARRDEQQARRNQLRIDTMLAVLTAIGISGVLAMVQAGFDVEGWGSVLLVGLVLLLAALVGLISYRWSRLAADPEKTR